ncbi:MAG: M28 family peptidase [candidate division KSB1 bacterium]|nr:M28 family peptidase [candidate division KSB1 bacterium]MDZ7367620.1 M28 family peptidase [candidate division KSB1 bacterium]MDZ7405412.1 M28 family peptidase [candidate division KSB1 bacterium]
MASAILAQPPAQNNASKSNGLESQFDSHLNRDNLRHWMKRMAARPHHVGSAYGKENAEFMAAQFKSWGYDTQIEEFYVLFPTPKTRVLEMIAPVKFKPTLAEPALKEDATSNQISEQLPVYNAYSIDGDVTGELVYVNYGVPKDYEELEQRGVEVKGKIVIARYGGSWRGIKPKVAAEHGAIGCLIYSDPRDDGYFQGEVYPKGAYRNERGAQRGSVADMPLYPGDPLTPGIGATKEAKRFSIKEAPTLTKIPVMPISYGDAKPLLAALGGPVAPESWRGALPITYHLGPGPAKVRLKLEFNWDIKPLYNVIAKMRGSEYPDEWIIRGNHHDAWVNGADDPVSGMVATMEEARAIGELVKTGWKPKRTIVYCAWDAEEPGLIGSTEWAEAHADELKSKAVIYINSDSNGRGFLFAGGSHTLEKFVNQVARDVVDPQKKISVAERARALRIVRGSPEDRKEARDRSDLRLFALGSGSDYTPFLQHLGIASLHIGYGGEDGGGSYHSIYDSFDHYTRFGDSNFEYGVALAQTAGRLVLRLADQDVLPFEFMNCTETIAKYAKEVMKLADDMREETEELNRRLTDKTLEAVADPKETYVAPKPQAPVPYLNFSPLQNAVAKAQQSARSYDRAMNGLMANGKSLTAEKQKALNTILMNIERALTSSAGLPRRPWFTHQIYAPGFYTGYGVKTLPAVREAIEQRNWDEAEAQIVVVAQTLERFANEIERATAVLWEATH